MTIDEIKIVGEWRIHSNSVAIINDLLYHKENDINDLKRLRCSYAVSSRLQEYFSSIQCEIVERKEHLSQVKKIILEQIDKQDSILIAGSFGSV